MAAALIEDSDGPSEMSSDSEASSVEDEDEFLSEEELEPTVQTPHPHQTFDIKPLPDREFRYSPQQPHPRRWPSDFVQRLAPEKNPSFSFGSPMECVLFFIPREIVEEMVLATNESGRRKFGATFEDCDVVEMEGFIGALLYLGANGMRNTSVEDIWATDGYHPVHALLVTGFSRNRFTQLWSSLSFERRANRIARAARDPLYGIRAAFTIFQNRLVMPILPGAYVCIDEQLIRYYGNDCSFTVFLKDKPARNGIKIFMATTARNPTDERGSTLHYVYESEIYTAENNLLVKAEEGKVGTYWSGEQVLLRLAEIFQGFWVNITADRYFTTPRTAVALYEKKVTLLGTVRSDRRGLPQQFKDKTKPSQPEFLYEGPLTVVRIANKRRTAILLSTNHHDSRRVPPKNKPELVQHYNVTKAGTDTINRMAATMSCHRMSRSLEKTIFTGHILNVAWINGYTLFRLSCNTELTRRSFLLQAASGLLEPQIERRARDLTGMSSRLRGMFQIVLQSPPTEPSCRAAACSSSSQGSGERGRCRLCMSERSTSKEKYSLNTRNAKCATCGDFVCKRHRNDVHLCDSCFK